MTALADTAAVGAGDKLSVHGVFDTIFAETFPAVHEKMVVVVRLLFDPGDADTERLVRIRLVDSRGRRLFEQQTRAQIGRIPPGDAPATNLIYQLTNTTFHGPGRYGVLIDAGRSHVRIPFRVVVREA